jgi:hypothetical protein
VIEYVLLIDIAIYEKKWPGSEFACEGEDSDCSLSELFLKPYLCGCV